jgi:outer membrane protein/protease secretion system outer membrane protein
LLLSTQRSRQAGARTTLDVLNAEQQLATVSRDLMQARYVALVSRLRLYALSGMEPDQAIAEVASAFEP